MFSGIVQASGVVKRIAESAKTIRLTLQVPKSFGIPAVGSSVAVNGCCLTVVQNRKELLFDLLRETWRVTAFSSLVKGDLVNLERPLRHGDEVGGHFVLGHVDGTGRIVRAKLKGADRELVIRAPACVSKYLIRKGSISVDGVSLTVARVSGNTFTVWIIPHTARQTTLGWKRPGNQVNLEADLILKFAEQQVKTRTKTSKAKK
jgi:riboflavin synthase